MLNKEECWQPELETMPREALEKLQVEKLRRSIGVALDSPFYGKRLGEIGITPESIHPPADIRKTPFTTKQDLRDNYPFVLVGGNMKDAIRIHSTNGTTGHPTVVTYSRHDIDSWANMIARDMYMVGCRDTDVFQNSSGHGMFAGGLGFQYGAEKLGATTVPAAAGNSKRQVMFIRDFGKTCTQDEDERTTLDEDETETWDEDETEFRTKMKRKLRTKMKQSSRRR